ncbi:MAG: hypothetical protein K0R24_1738, partial [Gammaproteobacteria bacterium]|nr:hypothetical protein [Gammaproteobacteria bacterium]
MTVTTQCRKEKQKNWTVEQTLALYALPFPTLLYQAQTTHQQYFP